jgi:leucyl-tRNA synthetase
MAVPAHDQRDYMFATKYNLPIKPVLEGGDISQSAWEGEGTHINSDFANGLDIEKASEAILRRLEESGQGAARITYKLRDWLISRQRYWGAPIPIVYCDSCGAVPVPYSQLPVKLPFDVEFRPDGKSPLHYCDEFTSTTCPNCGGAARREVDTMDTFVCSSWYELRYPDAHNSEKPFDKELLKKMLPVDKYVGGKEHSILHLIYARFIFKALRDCGYFEIDEPFVSLVQQGQILGPDGLKMSKSLGNTISPDDYIDVHGCDVFRTYLMFGFNYFDGGPWSDDGIVGVSNFMRRFIKLVERVMGAGECTADYDEHEKKLDQALHIAIKGMTSDLQAFKFNTAIAKMMTLYNSISDYMTSGRNTKALQEAVRIFIRLMAPAAPHVCEELWESVGETSSILLSGWPQWDESKLVVDNITIAVQFNGKLKTTIQTPHDASEEQVLEQARECVPGGAQILREIYIPKRTVNFVIKR